MESLIWITTFSEIYVHSNFDNYNFTLLWLLEIEN